MNLSHRDEGELNKTEMNDKIETNSFCNVNVPTHVKNSLWRF